MSAAASGIEDSRRSAHFLSLLTWTRDDLDTILDRAAEIVAESGRLSPLAGRRALLLWEIPGGKARESFHRALSRAGAEPTEREGRALLPESPATMAARLQDYDVTVYRAAAHPRLQALARSSPIPVVSAGSSYTHPFGVLAELFGLGRCGVDVDGAGMVWAGSVSPRLHSWLEAAVRFRFALDVILPPGERADPALTTYATARARGSIRFPAAPGPPAGIQVVLLGEGGRSLLPPGGVHGDPVYVEEDGSGPWGEEADAAVALGVLEEVWTRTRRARRLQP